MSGYGRGVEHHPRRAEDLQVRVTNGVALIAKIFLGGGTLLPERRQWGSDRGLAAILRVVRNGAAQRDGAEGLGVFAIGVHVASVEREERILWCVLFRPQEGLDPRIGVLRSAPR